MKILLLIAFVFLMIVSPTFRCIVFNPFKTVKNAVIDIYKYFKYKRWNEAKYGYIYCYMAEDSKGLGCGKTLSSVEYLTCLYEKYNNKLVWDERRKKWVTQKICIMSNVAFKTIDYVELLSLKQYINFLNYRYEQDNVDDTLTVTLLHVDEAGSAFNSRSFKDNFDALSIKTIVTCRHFKSAILLTSQRFGMVDALLRSITNICISCSKLWRLQRLNYYDAYDMENAQNPVLVQPFKKECWFITDKSFAKYDTYQLVKDIEKKCKNGDMLSEQEILANKQINPINVDGVIDKSRKYKRVYKKLNK